MLAIVVCVCVCVWLCEWVCSVYKKACNGDSSSSSRSSDGNSSLPDEGGSASQVPQASVQLAG